MGAETVGLAEENGVRGLLGEAEAGEGTQAERVQGALDHEVEGQDRLARAKARRPPPVRIKVYVPKPRCGSANEELIILGCVSLPTAWAVRVAFTAAVMGVGSYLGFVVRDLIRTGQEGAEGFAGGLYEP